MKSRIEKESSFWNSFSNKYDKFINNTVKKTYQQMYKLLKIDIANSDLVLEIATGTGLLSFEICKHVKQIEAIDIAQNMIEIAQKKQKEKNVSNINFGVGDSCNLRFADNSFDNIIASNVLHLLFEPEKSLSEIRRVLKPEGKAILPTFCHADNFKSVIISRFMSIFGFQAPNKWSTKSFQAFVEENGFKVIKSEIIKGKIPLLYLLTEKSEC